MRSDRRPAERVGAAAHLERMLWQNAEACERFLYGLDPSDLRLRGDYRCVQPPLPASGDEPASGETLGAGVHSEPEGDETRGGGGEEGGEIVYSYCMRPGHSHRRPEPIGHELARCAGFQAGRWT